MKNTRIIGFFLFGFILYSCGKPDAICECISVSDELNKKSNEVLQRTPTKDDESELKTLRAEKKHKCAAFETMSGTEMMERKSSCK